MVTVSHFKGGSALPHILTPTFTTGSKINHKTVGAVHPLLDPVGPVLVLVNETPSLMIGQETLHLKQFLQPGFSSMGLEVLF